MLATLLLAPYAFSKPPELADALMVGDSLCGQLAPRFAKEATARGKKFLYNYRAGSSTRQWLLRGWFKQVVAAHPARIVLVSLGTNCTRAERPGLRKDMFDVQTQCRRTYENGERGAMPILWLLPPPLKFSTDYIWKAVGKIPFFFPDKLPLESDGIHPTDAGHKQWAALLAKELWG